MAGAAFRQSQNEYDWLGPGIYFWEANPRRGLSFARELKALGRAKVDKPAVVGAVIDSGLCLDLMTAVGIEQVQAAYEQLVYLSRQSDDILPANKLTLDDHARI